MIVMHLKFLCGLPAACAKSLCSKCQFSNCFESHKSLIIALWFSYQPNTAKLNWTKRAIINTPILSCCEAILSIDRELISVLNYTLWVNEACSIFLITLNPGLSQTYTNSRSVKRRLMYQLGTIYWINIVFPIYVEFKYSDSSVCTDHKRICYW